MNRTALATLLSTLLAAGALSGQVLESLEVLSSRTVVSPPESGERGGPKAIVTADLDGDGRPDFATANTQGTVSVFFNDGNAVFDEQFMEVTGGTLRDIVASDWTGDGLPDLLVTDPIHGSLILIENGGGRVFAPPVEIPAWALARNLAAGDFDGDGLRDVFVAGNGVGGRQYRALPGGGLAPVVDFLALRSSTDPIPEAPASADRLKPVYSLESFRPAGSTRDELLVANASGKFAGGGLEGAVHLAPNESGVLLVVGQIPMPHGTRGLKTGKLLRRGDAEGPVDLIALHSYPLEEVHIHAGVPGAERFEREPSQRIVIPGGPRAAVIADFDGDGWNDIAVAVRNANQVVTLRNVGGRFGLGSTAITGVSPRDMVQADFSGDGQPDVAVINRHSSDVSLLHGFEGEVGFATLDAIYSFDGDLADLAVEDIDASGRAELITLNRASGELAVHRTDAEGVLSSPDFYLMGTHPNSLVLTDVNGDGHTDVAVGARDPNSRATGMLGLRAGDGTGRFGELKSVPIASLHAGAYIFSVKAFDLDEDGVQDLAVGVFDCSGSRIIFMRGQGEGLFTESNIVPFPRARGMGLADFDGDQDADFVAVSLMGELAVLENRGSLLSANSVEKTSQFDLRDRNLIPTGLEVHHLDAGGDPDLVVPTNRGVLTYLGGDGVSFDPDYAGIVPGDQESFYNYYFGSATPILFDINGDDALDMVALSPNGGQGITVYFGTADGKPFSTERSVSFPISAGRRLASGDLDGDGVPDLVGADAHIWTALSSRRPRLVPPRSTGGERTKASRIVINEILAINNELGSPLPQDVGRNPDWVEIYGGLPSPRSLAGWRLVLERGEGDTRAYTFPPDEILESGERRLIVFSGNIRSPRHTGFPLPGDGATLVLLNETGALVDRVEYGPQFDNASYGRFEDGVETFTYFVQPSAGSANAYTGSVPPVVRLTDLEVDRSDPRHLTLRVTARGRDESGIESVGVFTSMTEFRSWRRVELDDVTPHDEETSGVRTFRGEARFPPAWAGVLKVFVEATDLSGLATSDPGDASTADVADDDAPSFYYFAVEDSGDSRGLEISELVAKNDTGLRTGDGATSDWIELRNCSNQREVELAGFRLTKSLSPAAEGGMDLPEITLAPEETLIIFCDNRDSIPGELHAPFTLDAGGDEVVLVRDGVPGAAGDLADAPIIVDRAKFEQLPPDTAWARESCRGDFSQTTPTPGSANVPGVVERGDVNMDGRLDISDPVGLLGHLFLAASAACPKAGDVDADGGESITDAIYMLQYLFQGGAPLRGGPLGVANCR